MALFLIIRAVPSLQANKANFFTSSEFSTNDADNLRFGIADLFQVTVLSSVFASGDRRADRDRHRHRS